MKFMGDFPLKGQTEQELVAAILKVHKHEQNSTCKKLNIQHSFYAINLLLNLVKWGSWSDKGRSLLPSDEASHGQHQLQAVRPPVLVLKS